MCEDDNSVRKMYFFLLLIATFCSAILAGPGSVELDEHTFDKLISKFPAVLVKFDVAFPYGDKHDAYTALARESSTVEELLVAEVGVKDYGEKDNEALAKKYGASKDNFPVVKLFIRGKDKPVTFDSDIFTTEELRRFIRKEAGIYLSLPGCIPKLDQMALQFMSASNNKRQTILDDLVKSLEELKENEVASGKIYKLIMDKVMEKGDDFIATELERVKKLLSGKVSDEKKKQLNIRVNILQTFQLKPNRDEL